jgi:cytochrome c oxidase assembly factor CtaG
MGAVAPKLSWSLEPVVQAALLAMFVVYLLGWRRARRPGEPHPPGIGRLTLFTTGLLTIAVALISPLDSLGDQLMVMHMVQHMLLLDIAPVLLVLGLTKGILRPLTRRFQGVERRAGPLAHPAFAVLLYASLLWLWHVPALYDRAQGSAAVHVLEHACFLIAGSVYWWHLASPVRSRLRLGGLGPVGYLVSSKLLVGILGIVLAFAPTALYSFYAHQPHYWGLTPLDDQMMAGLVMALEQSVVMGIALVVLFVRMLGEEERDAQRAERFEIA